MAFSRQIRGGTSATSEEKIGDVNHYHRHGDIGLLIGEKDTWKRGIATEAIRLCVAFAFLNLNLNKVTAGMYAPNVGSYKAFLKNGFREIGRLRKHVFYEGEYVDGIKMELLKEDWARIRNPNAALSAEVD